jgi:hypothetical protein
VAATWTLIAAGHSVRSTQGLNEPGEPLDGLALKGVAGCVVYVECPNGTFTGTGRLKAFLADPLLAGWARAPDFDLVFGPDHVGSTRVAFAFPFITNPRGAIAHLADAVGVTGAAGLKLLYTCTLLNGGAS